MREEGRISLWQFFLLVTGFLIGTSTLIIPVGPAKQDAWLAILLAGVLGLNAAYLYTALGRRFPRETPLQYAPRVLGRWLGTFLNIIFLWYVLHLAALVLRNVIELYKLVIMPKTPMLVFAAVLAGLAAWSIRLGIENLARTAEILVPFIIVVIAILTALTLITPDIVHWEYLLPFMERGALPILRGAYDAFVFPFGEAVLFLVFIPFLTKPEKSMRPFALAIILATLGTSGVLMRNIVVLGVSEAERMAFPSLIAIQQVAIAEFLTRLEPLIIFVWTFSVYLKLVVVYYVFVLGTAQALNLKDYRPLVLPMGVLLTFFSLSVHENIMQMFIFAARGFAFYFIPAYLIYPGLLLVVAKIRNIKG